MYDMYIEYFCVRICFYPKPVATAAATAPAGADKGMRAFCHFVCVSESATSRENTSGLIYVLHPSRQLWSLTHRRRNDTVRPCSLL